jgi:hypothetical protein
MATATIQVAYEAETSSLKATVNEINQINDTVVKGAQESASKVKTSFNSIANSFTAAFSGGEAKKAIDNQAKAIDNLGKSGKSLTGQLRALKGELAQLEIAGQDGTDAFNQLLISAAKLEDQIGDTRDRVKILASDTFKFDAAVGATQALASGFETASGLAALFGGESEELQKVIARVTAATAVANGVQQLSSLIKEESAVKTALLTGATAAYNVVVGTSTGALKAFRIALASTGVGLLVIGLAALVANFDKVKDAIFGTSDSTRALAGTLDATKTALEGATAETEKVGSAFELAGKGVISKEAALIIYNETLGNSLGKTNDFNKAEQNFINKKGAYIEATAARAKAQALLAQAAVLAAEAAVAGEEDVRSTSEKILAFTTRAGAAFVDLTTAGVFNATEQAKEFNNTNRKLSSERVASEKNAQVQIRQDLANSEFEKAAIIEKSAGILSAEEQQILDDAQAKRDAANEKAKAKAKEAADKQRDAEKKAAEDQAKAREQLLKIEEQAFVDSLDAQSKILNDNNNKIIELEKTFAAARFKAGSEEAIQAEKQLATAIAEIRTQELTQLAVLDKAANEKLLKDKLDVAKAGEDATLQQQLAALEAQQTIELSFAETLGLSELEISTRYATQIAKVKTDIAAATLQTQINELKTLEIEEGSSLDRRVALINIEADKRRQTAKDSIKDQKQLASELELINAETQQAITEENQAEFEKRISLAEQYTAQVSNILGLLNDISKTRSEERIAEIESTRDAELEAINATSDLERDKERQRAALAKRTAQAISAEKTKQARQDKALALFEIGINTAQGIISALASKPPNPILAAFIATTGAIQAAAVAAKPIPKFAKGGLIGGKLHSQGGTMIEAEQGEYMVNRRQTAKHRRELDAMNTSTEAFRKMIDEKYVRPALMSYSAGKRGKEGVVVNASLNSKSMEKEMRGMRKDLKNRNVIVNINQQDSRYTWQ